MHRWVIHLRILILVALLLAVPAQEKFVVTQGFKRADSDCDSKLAPTTRAATLAIWTQETDDSV